MFLTLIGTLIIAYINNILSINNVDEAYRLLAKGVIIVATRCSSSRKASEGRRISGADIESENETVCSFVVCGRITYGRRMFEAGNGFADHRELRGTSAFSQCNLGEPWRVQMNADIKAAAAKHADRIKSSTKMLRTRLTCSRARSASSFSRAWTLISSPPRSLCR